jgi:hypothetical protein
MVRRKTAGLRAVVWILLLAFTLQSYVTQTHIHGAHGVAGVGVMLAKVPGHDRSPAGNDAADCPFCQAIVHAGAFFTPAALVLFLPFVWVEGVAPSVLAHAISIAAAHSWRSRAPPRN